MADYNNAKPILDNDFIGYNMSLGKYEPRTFEQEAPNYLTLRQLNNTTIATVTDTLIRCPIFNQININQTLIGDFVGIITSYSIRFTRQCVVSFNFNFTSNSNNFNAYLTLNNDVTIFFQSVRSEGNGSAGISFIHQFSANDEVFFNTDKAGSIYGVSLAIREIVYNKKVINNIVDTGTTFALLDDVNILLPQNNQIPQYNSTSGKWENKTLTGYTHESF